MLQAVVFETTVDMDFNFGGEGGNGDSLIFFKKEQRINFFFISDSSY